VGKSENFVFIAGTDWELALSVQYWDYPDYKAVVPKEYKTKLVMDIKELDRVLENFSNLHRRGTEDAGKLVNFPLDILEILTKIIS
jgi:DNA polymerase III sliding clamp (beta) subunit (PCNA family)